MTAKNGPTDPEDFHALVLGTATASGSACCCSGSTIEDNAGVAMVN